VVQLHHFYREALRLVLQSILRAIIVRIEDGGLNFNFIFLKKGKRKRENVGDIILL